MVSSLLLPRRKHRTGRLFKAIGAGSLRRLRLFLLALALLAGPHFGVEAVPAPQLGVRAALGDAALVEHDDLVGVDHGRKAVSDDDRGAARGDALQRFLDRGLGAA